MYKIGVLYGMEESFPPALVDRINSRIDTFGIANLKAKRSIGSSIQPASNRPALGKLERIVEQVREGLR